MNREEFERLIAKIIETNKMLAVAQANITEVNAEIIDMIKLGNGDLEADAGPTIQ